jgi:hypothetical protein
MFEWLRRKKTPTGTSLLEAALKRKAEIADRILAGRPKAIERRHLDVSIPFEGRRSYERRNIPA